MGQAQQRAQADQAPVGPRQPLAADRAFAHARRSCRLKGDQQRFVEIALVHIVGSKSRYLCREITPERLAARHGFFGSWASTSFQKSAAGLPLICSRVLMERRMEVSPSGPDLATSG